MQPPPHPISEADFFYVRQDSYDDSVELAVPFYQEMHGALLAHLPRSIKFMRVLDLGCGTGKTAKHILDKIQDSTLVGFDLFDSMLAHARKRLVPFGSRVELHQGDFRIVPIGVSEYDTCVSALAIHHSTLDEKRSLFRKIFTSLKQPGKFLMIDWTTFKSPDTCDVATRIVEQFAHESIIDQGVAEAWCDHWKYKNIPETVETLQGSLVAAGFKTAECVFRYYGLALICAEKK